MHDGFSHSKKYLSIRPLLDLEKLLPIATFLIFDTLLFTPILWGLYNKSGDKLCIRILSSKGAGKRQFFEKRLYVTIHALGWIQT